MKWYSRLLPPTIIAAAAAIRLFGLTHSSLWFDELYNIWFNKFSLGDMINEAIAGGHPPLYYLINRVWLSAGTGEKWVRLLSCVAGTGAVWLTYLAAKELFSRRVGLWAGAMAAFSPFLIWYSRAANYYSFLTLVSMLSFYALVRACKRGGWRNWAGYAAATTLVLFSYFFGTVLLVAGVGVFVLLRDRKNKWPAAWVVSMTYLVIVAGATFFISKLSSAESSRLYLPIDWLPVLKSVAASPFVLMNGFVDPIQAFTGGDTLSWSRLLVLLLLLAGLCALLIFKKTRQLLLERKTIAVSLYTFLLIVGPLSLQFMNQGALNARFFFWATPVFMILGAIVISWIPGKASLVFGGLTVAVLLTLSIWQNETISIHQGWRSVMSNISRQQQDTDMLVCFPIHDCEVAADYYLPRPLPIAGGMLSSDSDAIFFLPPGTRWKGYISGYWMDHGVDPALAGDQFEARLNSDLSQANRLWLVADSTSFEKHPSIEKSIEKNWRQSQALDDKYLYVRLYIRK